MMWHSYGVQYLRCNWYKCFKDSQKSVDSCSKCLSTSTDNAYVTKVNIIVCSNTVVLNRYVAAHYCAARLSRCVVRNIIKYWKRFFQQSCRSCCICQVRECVCENFGCTYNSVPWTIKGWEPLLQATYYLNSIRKHVKWRFCRPYVAIKTSTARRASKPYVALFTSHIDGLIDPTWRFIQNSIFWLGA